MPESRLYQLPCYQAPCQNHGTPRDDPGSSGLQVHKKRSFQQWASHVVKSRSRSKLKPKPKQSSGPITLLTDLPTELLLQIESLLELPSRACFALICRTICYAIGTASWDRLNTPGYRPEKLLFLQTLAKDLASSYACKTCIRLHATSQPSHPGGSVLQPANFFHIGPQKFAPSFHIDQGLIEQVMARHLKEKQFGSCRYNLRCSNSCQLVPERKTKLTINGSLKPYFLGSKLSLEARFLYTLSTGGRPDFCTPLKYTGFRVCNHIALGQEKHLERRFPQNDWDLKSVLYCSVYHARENPLRGLDLLEEMAKCSYCKKQAFACRYCPTIFNLRYTLQPIYDRGYVETYTIHVLKSFGVSNPNSDYYWRSHWGNKK